MEAPLKSTNKHLKSPKLEDGSRIPDGLYFVELCMDGDTAIIFKFNSSEIPRGDIIWEGGWSRAAHWIQKRERREWHEGVCFVVKQQTGPWLPGKGPLW